MVVSAVVEVVNWSVVVVVSLTVVVGIVEDAVVSAFVLLLL